MHDYDIPYEYLGDNDSDDVDEFVRTNSRRHDPATSKQAAREIAHRAERQCDLVWGLLWKYGPISNVDLHQRALNLGILDPRRRISTLRKQGWDIKIKKGIVLGPTI